MARSEGGSIVRHLRWLLCGEQCAGQSDSQLLERFVQERDETAFAALMRRHGRLVLGVCRRVLRNVEDAEDVFQATFVILARKAGTIRRPDAVGSWLYNTAYRLAQKQRVRNLRKRIHENQAASPEAAPPEADVSWREVREILDEQIAALPDKYRAPLLLCYFEGRTQEDAARQLGWHVRTLQVRLVRGRELLRRRLAKRGLELGSALAAVVLTSEFALAHVPAAVAQSACEAAMLSTVGEAITSAVPASVATIVQGAMREMATLKLLKYAAALVLVLSAAGTGLGLVLGQMAPGGETSNQNKKGALPLGDKPGQDKGVQALAPPPLLDAQGDPLPPGAVLRLGTTRLRHGGPVLSIAWSPDGTSIASGGSNDLAVRLWEASTGKELRYFQMHRSNVQHVAISPDGNLAASVDQQGSLYLWDPATAKTLKVRQMNSNAMVLFSANGKSLASIDDQGQACLIESATLETLRTFKLSGKLQSPVTVVAWSETNKKFASADALRKVRLFDTVTGLVQHTLDLAGDVACMGFAPNGKVLATAGQDNAVELWDTTSGTKIGQLEGHQGAVKAISWSPDGKSLVSGSADKTVRVWDVDTGQALLKFTRHPAAVECVVFSPDGKMVASAADNMVRIWDSITGKDIVPDNDHGRLAGLVVAQGGKTVVTCGTEPILRVWLQESSGQRSKGIGDL